MGWLFMRSLGGHATPKAYLDAQFTYTRPEHPSRVLKSALVGLRTYYAAVEHGDPTDEAREIWALVCLVRYNPRDREGYVFGYKDMSESMGPCEDACPSAILDLLTPTTNPLALDWRARCRARLAERQAIRARPSPRPGDTVILAQPMRFQDGAVLSRLHAVRHPGRPRMIVYRSEAGGLYRIPRIKTYAYALVRGSGPRDSRSDASG